MYQVAMTSQHGDRLVRFSNCRDMSVRLQSGQYESSDRGCDYGTHKKSRRRTTREFVLRSLSSRVKTLNYANLGPQKHASSFPVEVSVNELAYFLPASQWCLQTVFRKPVHSMNYLHGFTLDSKPHFLEKNTRNVSRKMVGLCKGDIHAFSVHDVHMYVHISDA